MCHPGSLLLSYAHQLIIFPPSPIYSSPSPSPLSNPEPSHTHHSQQLLPLVKMALKFPLFAFAFFLLVTAKVSSSNEEHVFMEVEDVGMGNPLKPPVVYPAPTPAPAPAPAGPIIIKTWKVPRCVQREVQTALKAERVQQGVQHVLQRLPVRAAGDRRKQRDVRQVLH
ncbi:hypothetical protein DsansV1_C16g0142481 [Dioscorea sansibarensis]